jgi:hypothetical protein
MFEPWSLECETGEPNSKYWGRRYVSLTQEVRVHRPRTRDTAVGMLIRTLDPKTFVSKIGSVSGH